MCSKMIVGRTETKTLYSLTKWRSYRKCHSVAGVFDEVHNVSMMEIHDINVIYCQNAVTNM
jgi:hypothetical protein